MIILNQRISIIQNYAIWIQIASFVIHIKAEDVYEDIANDFEKRFDTSNYKIYRPLPTGKKERDRINEKWIRWKNYNRICRA